MEQSQLACVRGPMTGTFPSCQRASKYVQVLENPSAGDKPFLRGKNELAKKRDAPLTLDRGVDGFSQCGSQVSDERLIEHARGKNGENDDLVTTLRQRIPFRAGLIE
jgi:hypothetical protein